MKNEQSEIEKKNQHLTDLQQVNPWIGPFCSNYKKAHHICGNEKCTQNAFICSDEKCICKQNHRGCLKILSSSIVDVLKQNKIQTDSIQLAICNQIDKMIDKLSDFRDKIIMKLEKISLTNKLSKEEQELVDHLQKGQGQFISGSMIWPIIINTNSKQHSNTIKNLQLELKIKEKFALVNQKMKKQLFDHVQRYVQILQQKQPKLFSQSLVIKTFEEIETLNDFFDRKQIKNAELIYRASENKFDVENFWTQCINIPNTLVILENEYGFKIGGYTPLEWQFIPIIPLSDQSLSSFIFSLTSKDKFTLKNHQNAIVHHNDKNYGPCYGEGRDLIISNKSNQNLKSECKINTTYFNQKYQRNEASYKMFCGNCTPQFKIKEWEVWKLSF